MYGAATCPPRPSDPARAGGEQNHRVTSPADGPLDAAAGRGPAWLDEWLSRHGSDLVAWRRRIHANPELGFAEHVTTALIVERLTSAGLRPTALPPGTGVICDIGAGSRGVALGADLDALALTESTGSPFASTVDGVMHACGHDAHTAILIGTALALAEAPALPGRIRAIFQPAEEVIPGGALEVIAAGALSGVERIFAL